MIEQAMRVLRLFRPERPDLGVTEAAELLGKPKSTVSRWLRQMEDAGFLDREAHGGRYRLSLALAALGEVARSGTSLQRQARPVLEGLVARTGETCNLVVLDGDAAVNVEVVRSSRPVQHVGVLGRRLPLHATAAGKVLMAWSSPDEWKGRLELPLRRWASCTTTDVSVLARELEQVREVGYATAWRELEEDLAAASAPVRDHRGMVIAAVTASAPTSRMSTDGLGELAQAVKEAADSLSDAMGHDVDRPFR
jgi:IclR family transcriptional regulator, acetate operon repressor